MKRKMFICLAVIAMASTTAMAAQIVMLPVTGPDTRNGSATGYQYHVQSISQDGSVVGFSVPLDVNGDTVIDGDYPAYYDWASSTMTTITNKGTGSARGVGTTANGVVVAGDVTSNGWLGLGSSAGVNSFGYLKTSSGALNIAYVANMNALTVDENGDGYIVGEVTNTNKGLAWTITGGVVNTTATWERIAVSGNLTPNGVSAKAHIGVGTDRSGRANTTDGPVLFYVNDSVGIGGWVVAPWAGALDTRGQGNGISGNGYWAGDYFYDALTSNSLHGFRNDVRRNITTELFPVGFDPTQTQQTNVFDVADNGMAVGFTYKPKYGPVGYMWPSYKATVWFGTCERGFLLEQILMDLGVDIYAEGWAYLERAIGISDDGTVITGRGVLASDGSYRAFVAVIPEPATMSFLALGGLALLRRRR